VATPESPDTAQPVRVELRNEVTLLPDLGIALAALWRPTSSTAARSGDPGAARQLEMAESFGIDGAPSIIIFVTRRASCISGWLYAHLQRP
jgi:hypothetical protein